MFNQAFGMTITRIALGIILFAHGYILKVEEVKVRPLSIFGSFFRHNRISCIYGRHPLQGQGLTT